MAEKKHYSGAVPILSKQAVAQVDPFKYEDELLQKFVTDRVIGTTLQASYERLFYISNKLSMFLTELQLNSLLNTRQQQSDQMKVVAKDVAANRPVTA